MAKKKVRANARSSGRPRGAPATSVTVDKTLQKGLRIIELLGDAGHPLGVSEIAESLRLTKSNVHRLLQTLCAAGWAIQHAQRGTYDLSLRSWEVGVRRLSTLNLPQIGYRQASELARASEESVHIAVLEQMDVVFLETIDTPKPVRAYAPVGGRIPAYCAATGKAILAFMPQAEVNRHLKGLRAFTEQTITDAQQLLAELAQIRRRGYAVNRSEWQQGVDGVAAPIFAHDTVVGSIGLSGPADRFGSAAMKRFVPMVREAAATISSELRSRPA
jgi:IclR family transcriptional regulator, KDG regulon repressor